MQKDKLKVGIIVDNDFNNDIRVRKEVRVLKDNGYNVFVLCLGYDDIEYKEIKGVKIERIKIKKKTKDILFAIQNSMPFYYYFWKKNIKKFILKFNISIIHTHDLYMSKPVYLGIKLSQNKIPMVLDLHENYPAAINSYNWTKGILRSLLTNPKRWYKKEKEYLKYPDRIIVLSEDYKQVLLSRYNFLNSSDIIVYPNVIDFERFNNYKIDSRIKRFKHPTLLYFGGVAERRGIFDTINAIKTIIKKGINLTLLIIGPVDKADKNRFYLEIEDEIVKNNIEYIPWIDISELLSYLNVTDICLAPFHKNPQHESGIANKLFQYMYGGKPIVASDCAPQKRLIESANCGIIYSNQNEYVIDLIKLIRDEDLRKKMGANAKKALHLMFEPKKIDQKLIDLYRNLKMKNN